MSKTTKKDAPKKAKKKAEPKRKTEKDLLQHGIVPGTLRFETKGQYANKQTVERVCADDQGLGDGHKFRLATSDLFQKDACDECMKVRRRERAKAKRAAKREEAKKAA
jgi:hypothetical protein